ncbi:glycosyltransferase family 4 protein [Lyngbya sp. CCY1209]|uniref:glycosyltransferase family 4 protein n=1 Tax=Lyngbya sp. CCY1209 TaxID=2886103 RepID=UPI002D1FFA8D|nr:glycosyltransferase family 4 protein [Lyngbya sp. CCY1209]MEB3886874.1 glycosyltransferase family 4 protein [Lyngbya sp. CCY1209]
MDNSNHKFENKRIKLGIIANEFFELSQGRMGGFGWATRQVTTLFNSDPNLGVEPVLLAGETYGKPGEPDPVVHNTKLILRQRNKLEYIRRLWAEKIDLILSIDYRPNYRPVFWSLPRTPIILWVRDPRPPEDVAKIDTVRVPGSEDVYPQGLKCFDCTSFAGVVRVSQWVNRQVLFATPARFLKAKVPGTYGVEPPEVEFLPNIIDMEPAEVVKSDKPTVVFLARLDPYKRPWLFAEIARHFPDVDFIFMGKPHFEGKGAWEPTGLPDNVKLMGHVGEVDKIRMLSEAWVLINTSIHEGLAVSFQEALKCETPILSCLDPESVVSRFGIYVGRYDGTGMEGIPKFVEGLKTLLENHELRTKLGKEGRKWVSEDHNKERFLEAFVEFCDRVGVKRSN